MASMNRHRIAITCVFIYLKAHGLLRHRQSKEPTERTDGYITIIWNRINFNAHFAFATPLFFVLIVLPSSSVEFRFSNFALLWRKHQLLLFILNRAWHFYLRILLNTSIFILLKIRLHESLCIVKLSLCRETKRKSNSSTWNSNICSSYINDLQKYRAKLMKYSRVYWLGYWHTESILAAGHPVRRRCAGFLFG